MTRESDDRDPPHTIAVRLARVSEHGALEALQRRASLKNPGDRDALLENSDAIDLPLEQITSGQVYVAEYGGGVVGFAAVIPREGGDSELDALFVEPEMWRMGIGRRLIDRCCAAARDEGSSALHVIGNPHAERFYESCGFETTGRAETRFGVGLLMRRVLSMGPECHD
jgi:N-acetylglutamate synthase-like GNAT family acetyltransferase